jgi:hypothetical protein
MLFPAKIGIGAYSIYSALEAGLLFAIGENSFSPITCAKIVS